MDSLRWVSREYGCNGPNATLECRLLLRIIVYFTYRPAHLPCEIFAAHLLPCRGGGGVVVVVILLMVNCSGYGIVVLFVMMGLVVIAVVVKVVVVVVVVIIVLWW